MIHFSADSVPKEAAEKLELTLFCLTSLGGYGSAAAEEAGYHGNSLIAIIWHNLCKGNYSIHCERAPIVHRLFHQFLLSLSQKRNYPDRI